MFKSFLSYKSKGDCAYVRSVFCLSMDDGKSCMPMCNDLSICQSSASSLIVEIEVHRGGRACGTCANWLHSVAHQYYLNTSPRLRAELVHRSHSATRSLAISDLWVSPNSDAALVHSFLAMIDRAPLPSMYSFPLFFLPPSLPIHPTPHLTRRPMLGCVQHTGPSARYRYRPSWNRRPRQEAQRSASLS